MWRLVEESDISATLSQKEIDAFAQSVAYSANAIPDLLSRTVAFTRSFIRAGKISLPKDEMMLPESLINATMDILAFNILKRLPVPVLDDRKVAYQDAINLLKDVANGKLSIEAYETEDPEDIEESNNIVPEYLDHKPMFRLDGPGL